jgi:predicted CoA-binding protein
MPTELDVFLQPRSIAVIGATERPLAWGSLIMEGLLAFHYPGKIYPVNRQSSTVYGVQAYPHLKSIPDSVELAVLTIPEASVEQLVQDCCEKGVKGITIVTAGFGEAIEGGRAREEAIAKLAGTHGIRIIGPNVSGTFNLHAGFNASPVHHLLPTPLAGISQGGYAFGDLLAPGVWPQDGVGEIHPYRERMRPSSDRLLGLLRERPSSAGYCDVCGDSAGWKAFLRGGSSGRPRKARRPP